MLDCDKAMQLQTEIEVIQQKTNQAQTVDFSNLGEFHSQFLAGSLTSSPRLHEQWAPLLFPCFGFRHSFSIQLNMAVFVHEYE